MLGGLLRLSRCGLDRHLVPTSNAGVDVAQHHDIRTLEVGLKQTAFLNEEVEQGGLVERPHPGLEGERVDWPPQALKVAKAHLVVLEKARGGGEQPLLVLGDWVEADDLFRGRVVHRLVVEGEVHLQDVVFGELPVRLDHGYDFGHGGRAGGRRTGNELEGALERDSLAPDA